MKGGLALWVRDGRVFRLNGGQYDGPATSADPTKCDPLARLKRNSAFVHVVVRIVEYFPDTSETLGAPHRMGTNPPIMIHNYRRVVISLAIAALVTRAPGQAAPKSPDGDVVQLEAF